MTGQALKSLTPAWVGDPRDGWWKSIRRCCQTVCGILFATTALQDATAESLGQRLRFLLNPGLPRGKAASGSWVARLHAHTTAILLRFIKQSFKDIPGIDQGAASDVMYAVLFICRLLMISGGRLGGTAPERTRLCAESHQP